MALLRYVTNGGGGFGDPLEREPERVKRDVRDGYVTIEGAARDYGVVVTGDPEEDPEGLAVDVEATERLRAGREEHVTATAPIAPPEPDLTPAESRPGRGAAAAPRRAPGRDGGTLPTTRRRRTRSSSRAGFYRMLVPRRYGGYEVDLPTFLRVIVAIARGCPSTAWCLCLASAHALQVGALFEEQAQAELFGDGDFRCAAVAAPTGVGDARRRRLGDQRHVGVLLGRAVLDALHGPDLRAATRTRTGHLPSCSSSRRAASGRCSTTGATRSASRAAARTASASSGAASLRHYVLENTWMVDTDTSRGTPGSRLHGNPMYAGRTLSFFQAELTAVMVGAVQGALDEYEEIIRTRKTQRPPIVPRYQDPDYQRWFGLAIGKTAAAEAALVQCAEQYMELCRRSVEDGIPFSREDDLRLNVIGREAMTLAWEAMQGQVFRTGGSSAAKKGERMERIWRDMSMGWSHFTIVVTDWAARELAREHLGVVAEVPRPDRERT